MKPSAAENARPDILHALRGATVRQHESIEGLMSLDRLGDRASYARILLGFDAFLRPWENAIRAAVPLPLRDWIARRFRHSLLEKDLAHFGITHRSPTAAPVTDLCGSLTRECAVFGSLYVMEGAALGGRVISRHLSDRLLIGPTTGAAYFHGHGPDTGKLWGEFQDRVRHAVPDDAESRHAACDAARRTFGALEAQLRHCLFVAAVDA